MSEPEDPNRTEPGGSADSPTGTLVASPGKAFATGEIASGRYRVLRFLSQGAMGEVYEAFDLELRERVALKAVRPEIAKDERAMERFRREVQVARRVTHPNVCRVFDVFKHGEATFLTMELLEGETLAERLQRTGRLAATDALPLVEQIAAGLDAAHSAGVVHRDFKSGNIVLVAAPSAASGTRAVLTDFGLARAETPSASDPVLTATGALVGTPAYMAPEQVEDGTVTAAADIYAFGVVLFEMLTGARPFTGQTPMSIAVKRLQEPPPSPRSLVPDLDARWEAAVLRCLARDPAARFSRATELLAFLRAPHAREPRRSRLLLVVLGAAAVLLAVTSALLTLRPGSDRGTTPAGPALRPRQVVAVLGFKNVAARPQAAWLGTAVAEMLTTELAAGEKLRLIPGEDVARMRTELSLKESEGFSKDTLALIRGNVGADLVVHGSYTLLGGDASGPLRLDVRLQDARLGETLVSLAETGRGAELFELATRTGARLRQALGIQALSPAESGSVRAALPRNAEATRLYAEGLGRLRVYDASGARGLLERAVAADPGHALSRSALAAAWSALGYDQRAREEARRAFEVSEGLPREDRLLVEGRSLDATKQWAASAGVYRRLFEFLPDDLDHGLRLASALSAGGNGARALETVAALRRLPVPARDDPRIDVAEAIAARSVSDFQRAQRSAAAAADKGRSRRARLIVARARLLESSALLSLGRADAAKHAAQEARRLYDAAGDRRGAAAAANGLAVVLWQQGEPAEAQRLYQEALSTHREIGNRAGEATALNDVGILLWQAGDLRAARRNYEASLELLRELGDRDGLAGTLNNVAVVSWQEGDLQGARRRYDEALALFQELKNRSGEADTLNNLGELLRQQGRLPEAERLHERALLIRRAVAEPGRVAMSLNNLGRLLRRRGRLRDARSRIDEALALARATGEKRLLADAQLSLGQALSAQGDLAGARGALTEALRLRREIGDTGGEGESRLALASLDIEDGQAERAAASAREVAGAFLEAKRNEEAAAALDVLASALLAQRAVADAQSAAAEALSALARSPHRALRLSLSITDARGRAAAGRREEALSMLAGVLAEARQLEMVELQLEARLAGLEIQAPRTAADDERRALAADARALGFGLIARKAEAGQR